MTDMTRRCGACEGLISPREVRSLLGIPFVHRYRCACTTRFEVVTGFGRVLLVGLNAIIVGVIAFAPASKFQSSDDRVYILMVLLGVQVPAVAILLWRSMKNAAKHPLSPR